MAQILIKRDTQAVVDGATLLPGELAVALDTGNVYIGVTSGKMLINPPVSEEATKLKDPRKIEMTGDGTWNVNFDGSANVTSELVLSNTGVTAGDYSGISVDGKGRITAARGAKLADIADAGTAAALTAGTVAGNVPVLNAKGQLDVTLLPSLALTDTYVVADQAAMLALTAEQGDICIRTDEGKTYILASGLATEVANWLWLKTPESPVSSVQGRTGDVVVTVADLALDKVNNTADADKAVLSAGKLTTARKLTIAGGVTMSEGVNFDGREDIIMNITSVNAASLKGTIDGGVISDETPVVPT